MILAQVVLDKATHSFDKEYDYILPEEFANTSVGCRVVVPFGKNNARRLGLIIGLRESEDAKNLKLIVSVLDSEPILNEEGLFVLKTLKATTFCTYSEALHTLIPPGAGLKIHIKVVALKGADKTNLSKEASELYERLLKKSLPLEDVKGKALDELLEKSLAKKDEDIKKKVADEKQTCVRLTGQELKHRLTAKQQEVYDFLENNLYASIKEITYFTSCGQSVIKKLISLGYAESFVRILPRKIESKHIDTQNTEIKLNGEQQKAYDDILGMKKGEALLFGVTGSGKTSVYIKLIEEMLNQKRKSIVLVPEISLTPQVVSLFVNRFGEKVAVLHSGLSMTERLDEWNKIKRGKVDIVVGTRSAIFAPLDNIGLIVIDEEQENTYHSEKSPRYHAHEIAKIRANYNNAILLLSSATPSIESFYKAKNGKILFCELKNRYSNFGLPQVEMIDLRDSEMVPNSSLFSEKLRSSLETTLENRGQAILLLNRRGYNTIVTCSSCKEIAKCPNCSIPLTYHLANNRLNCHYCGYSQKQDEPCKKCGSKMLRYTGYGTQKAEEELNILFPEAKILRLDADTTISRYSYQEKFTAFANGAYDIIIGTQMIAKGLDFPNVTLVGVINADQSLMAEDYRAFEKTFSMVTQVIGRSGRAEKKGKALIQTFSPENEVLSWAAKQSYTDFAKQEISVRKMCLYPPFCDMLCLTFSSEIEKEARISANKFLKELSEVFKEHLDIPIRVLGPAEATPFKIAGHYRIQLLVKCINTKKFRDILKKVIEQGKINPSVDFYF